MKKILHLINNNNDGIYHFVKKLVSTHLVRYDNLILSKYSNSENIIKLDSGKSIKEFLSQPLSIFKNIIEFFLKLRNKLRRDYYNFYYKPDNLFNFYFNEINFLKLKQAVKNIDIVIVYTFKEVISPKDLLKIKKYYNCKILFYPLDNELISGGFHFEDVSKENIKLGKKNNELIKYKKKYLSNLNIHWIAGNNFVEEKIKNSQLYTSRFHKISKIYNSYQPNNFSTKDIVDFKIKNNLEKYDLLLLFSSLKLADKRKGIEELKKCLKLYDKDLHNKRIAIISIGKEKNLKLSNDNIEHIHFDYIKNQEELFLLFASCNIFLNLSRYDFGPILCEIAFHNDLFILSSNVGIAKEIIENNLNGFIYNNDKELEEKFMLIIDLALKKSKPEYNSKILKMKETYKSNKIQKFEKILSE